MHELIRAIITTPWMINPSAVIGYAPALTRLLQGKQASFSQPNIESYITEVSSSSQNGGGNVINKVGIIPIRGVIMKDSQECGPAGLESKRNLLQQYLNDPEISAVVLDLDTPGGQASFLETFAKTIESADKPVLAYYNNMCASAGYYIASQCDEIYASEENDMVGSIGTVASFFDIRGHLEKEGIKYHEVYATQSTNKNKMFKQALEGNYTLLQSELLDPCAQNFIDQVKSNRNISNQEVFTGKTYLTPEAISNGLIDGIKSFNEVVLRAAELANQKSGSSDNGTQNNNENLNEMKNKNILLVATFLGLTALESKDGHISLSVENIEKLGVQLAKSDATATELETKNASISSLEEKLTGVEATANTNAALIVDMGTKLEAAINGKGATATVTAANPDEASPESDLNAEL